MKEIRQILRRYDNSDLAMEKLALARVVNVEESSYRRIGARMLVSSKGNWVGGISGGCLEGDALKRSQIAIHKNVSSKVVYDTMDDDANEIGVGLGCNGRIEVLFTPIDTNDPDNPIEALRKIESHDKPVVSICLIDGDSIEGKLGSSVAVYDLSDFPDFLGIDSKILHENTQLAFEQRRSVILETKDAANQNLKLLFEFIRPEMKLVIIGDNYDVSALVSLVYELGWEIYIVGRKRKIHKEIFNKVKAVYEYEEFDKVNIDEYTSIILMTHDYQWDKVILKKSIDLKPNYIGMLGPRKRKVKMEEDGSLGNLSDLDFLYSPVGLDLGAETPEEIAVAIIAEILTVFRNRNGRSLKYRQGTIHERV